MYTREQKEKICARLLRGDRGTIKERTGLSYNTIHKVLHGECKGESTDQVIKAAIDILKERKQITEDI